MINQSLQVEKTRVIFEHLHTDNQETDSSAGNEDNKIVIQFQAILVNTPDLKDGTPYHITAGFEYGGQSFIWLAQTEVTSNIDLTRVSPNWLI